ncbi:MAG TPA: NAD(P)-binding domain-containing protein [Longimicrobiales bacterium]|nr:NAD(P)-binding domain-containing protein [Longimicrobiales bacterium]
MRVPNPTSNAVAAALLLTLALTAAPLAAQTPPAVREGRAMRIGMIGAGSMGAPLGLGFAEAGHEVMFASRNPEDLMELVQQAAPRASAGYADAAAYFADVIVLAVPPVAIPQLGEDIGHLMQGKIVIDISNPRLDRDGEITNEWLAMGTGEAMAQYLPGTRFVKAFNTVNPRNFANPVSDGVRVGVPIATDDEDAAAITASLVRDMGLDPVFVGALSRAKEFDRGSPIWETGASAQEIRETLGLR